MPVTMAQLGKHSMNAWDEILASIRSRMPAEDFRRWFGSTWFASDSGDQITVWVTSEPIRRHIENHHADDVRQAAAAVGRGNSTVRFLVGGAGEDDETE